MPTIRVRSSGVGNLHSRVHFDFNRRSYLASLSPISCAITHLPDASITSESCVFHMCYFDRKSTALTMLCGNNLQSRLQKTRDRSPF